MTEPEWTASDNPSRMLAVLGDWASDRKLRLFAAALAREVAGPPFDPAIPIAVDAAERAAAVGGSGVGRQYRQPVISSTPGEGGHGAEAQARLGFGP